MSAGVVGLLVVGAVVFSSNTSNFTSSVTVLSQAAARTTSSGTAHSSTKVTATIEGRAMQLVSVQADEDFTNKTSAISLIDSQGNALETVRSIAGVAYISLTKISVPLPDGAHWVSITPADTHVDPKIASTLGSNDPSSGLKYLSAVNGDPKVIDTEKLDGADVTHYGFTVNLATLFDAVGKGGDALGVPGMGAGLAQLKSMLDLTKIPAEAWIDSSGRVRRFEFDFSISAAGQSLKFVSETQFSDFGEPVNVVAPASSDTVPFAKVPNFFSALVGAAAGGLSG